MPLKKHDLPLFLPPIYPNINGPYWTVITQSIKKAPFLGALRLLLVAISRLFGGGGGS